MPSTPRPGLWHRGRVVVRSAAGRVRHRTRYNLVSRALNLGALRGRDLLGTAQVSVVRVVLVPAVELQRLQAHASICLPTKMRPGRRTHACEWSRPRQSGLQSHRRTTCAPGYLCLSRLRSRIRCPDTPEKRGRGKKGTHLFPRHNFPSCTLPITTLPFHSSLPIQRPGLITRQDAGAPSATKPDLQAFFSPIISCNGGCAWETFGSAGFLYLRFISLRTAATPFA